MSEPQQNVKKPELLPVLQCYSAPINYKGRLIFISGDSPEIVRAHIVENYGETTLTDPVRRTSIVVGGPVDLPPIPPYYAFAAKLNGRECGKEITKEEEAEARELGLVVVFGYSDDCTEFRGCITDEVGLGELKITTKGKLLDTDAAESLESLQMDGHATDVTIKTIDADFDENGHSYRTEIPHAKFDIMEDGKLFCRGIVFSVKELPIL